MYSKACSNYTIWQALTHVCTLETITTTTKIMNLSGTPKVPSSLCHPYPREPLVCFLSLEISWHFLEFHINRITHLMCSVFCMWFFFFWSDFFHSACFEIHLCHCMYEQLLLHCWEAPRYTDISQWIYPGTWGTQDYLQVLVITNRALMYQSALTYLTEIPMSRIAEL